MSVCRTCRSLGLISVLIVGAGCALLTPSPKPPKSTSAFEVEVVNEREQPIDAGTRVDIVLRFADGSTISAYCEGNLVSGLIEPRGWVCSSVELGRYDAWWRNSGQIYVRGRDSNGKESATLFTVTGRSSG